VICSLFVQLLLCASEQGAFVGLTPGNQVPISLDDEMLTWSELIDRTSQLEVNQGNLNRGISHASILDSIVVFYLKLEQYADAESLLSDTDVSWARNEDQLLRLLIQVPSGGQQWILSRIKKDTKDGKTSSPRTVLDKLASYRSRHPPSEPELCLLIDADEFPAHALVEFVPEMRDVGCEIIAPASMHEELKGWLQNWIWESYASESTHIRITSSDVPRTQLGDDARIVEWYEDSRSSSFRLIKLK
jgi:hypothetical protein